MDKEDLRTWSVFTSALVDALWALGWYRRAAHVVAWVMMQRGLFEDLCVIQPREWKLDLRRLSSGTALVALYQWLGHLVLIARHFEKNSIRSSNSGEGSGQASGQLSGDLTGRVPEVLLPLLPSIPEPLGSSGQGLQEDPAEDDEMGDEFPPLITIVTGWGKLSKQEGSSIVKTVVQKEIMKLRVPCRPSLDSGRWMSTGGLMVPWLMSPATAARLALSDLAAEVDAAQ